MSGFRKGHLVRHKDAPKRRGRLVSVDVNAADHLGNYLIEWNPSGRITQIHPAFVELDDHPLRGRNVVLERAVDGWMEDL
jgi:hypothetical protein